MVWRRASWCLLAGAVFAATAHAGPVDTDSEHELVVYSLERYGPWTDLSTVPENPPVNWEAMATYAGWKSSIYLLDDADIPGVKQPFRDSRDPYLDFFATMRSDSGGYPAHSTSARFKDNEVTVDQMTTTAETSSDRGWSGSDLVFFYGHNTQLKPQEPGVSLDVWRRATRGFLNGWENVGIDWTTWGTAAEPYLYHRNVIDDASLSNAYAVFYAYNPLTSVLIGEDFPNTGAAWETENYKGGYDLYPWHTNTLGPETEWVIAHGCNAVTVATADGQSATPLGVNAWRKSWSGLHMVLGHYDSLSPMAEPDLGPFSASLRAGGSVKEAYFDVHKNHSNGGEARQSVIAASQSSCCNLVPVGEPGTMVWELVCPPAGCGDDFIDSDQWTTNNKSDLAAGDFYFETEWSTGQ